ncbi:MAG: dTDP-4-dehydrorhamnose reductase [Clostridium sp.]|nr:dTDP-4-dehydrorhamnose reductase [Clostridium sp.]
MNILITGANGQLGMEMRAIVGEHGDWNCTFSDVTQVDGLETMELDITDREAVEKAVEELGVNCIVNCAAYTNVDKAESDQQLCHKLNAEAPAILAEAMKGVGGLLVQISTDYVFGADGHNEPLTEEITGIPTGVYGQTKLDGEKAIEASGCNYAIIRTAWLYSEYGKNFVKTMLQLTATKPELKVVFDQVGTPTYALDLAKAIAKVVEGWKREGEGECKEIYHFSNEGVISWYDFAKAIAEMAGHRQCAISPCHSGEFPSPVKRPPYSVLDKTKIKERLGADVPYWRDSLYVCICNLMNCEL